MAKTPFGEVLLGERPFVALMQQRYYDSDTGRFNSSDPVQANANTGTGFNRFAYATNNPYRFIDPDGRAESRPTSSTPPECQDVECKRQRQEERNRKNNEPYTGGQGYMVALVAMKSSSEHKVGHVFVGGMAPNQEPVAFGWYPTEGEGALAGLFEFYGHGTLHNDTGLFLEALRGDSHFAMRWFSVDAETYSRVFETLANYGKTNDYGVVKNSCVTAAFSATDSAGLTNGVISTLPGVHPNEIYRVFKDMGEKK